MNFKLILKEELNSEVSRAVSYYESKQKNLGLRFLNYFEATIGEIKKHPFVYQVKYDGFRFARITPFPYLIFFEVIEQDIIIYQLFHGRQDPAKRYKTRKNK